MALLFITSLFLIILGLLYDPGKLLDKQSRLFHLSKIKYTREITGAVAVILGLTLIIVFLIHLISELKWFVVVIVGFTSFFSGMTFIAYEGEKKIPTQVAWIKSILRFFREWNEFIKKRFSPQVVIFLLMALAVVGTIFSLATPF